jgi:hypothetical protein
MRDALVVLVDDFLVVERHTAISQISECLSHAVHQVVALSLGKTQACVVSKSAQSLLGAYEGPDSISAAPTKHVLLRDEVGRLRSSCPALIPLALLSINNLFEAITLLKVWIRLKAVFVLCPP